MKTTTALTVLIVSLGGAAANAVTFDWATVGNPGNAADTTSYGSVGYNYRISTHEVTNAQYTEFLNGVDPTGANSLGLYSNSMSSEGTGGINLNGAAADGAKYEIKPGRDNNPVVFVSWYDAIRFANWMDNGMGSGDTETGAYTLLGGTPTPSNGGSITRNPGAEWWLPSEDEWYKAAYHKNDGVTGNYWDFATSTDTTPFSVPPPGSDAPDPSNTANFRGPDGFAVTGSLTLNNSQNYLADVGAYASAVSPYGTFDQSGNVGEWLETLLPSAGRPDYRVIRGGAWFNSSQSIDATQRDGGNPTADSWGTGFRVASIPEPSSTMLMGALASTGLLLLRKRY